MNSKGHFAKVWSVKIIFDHSKISFSPIEIIFDRSNWFECSKIISIAYAVDISKNPNALFLEGCSTTQNKIFDQSKMGSIGRNPPLLNSTPEVYF